MPKEKPDSRSRIDALIKELKTYGQEEDARALKLVDTLMREYAYTEDPLSKDAEDLGISLREVVNEWITCRKIMPPKSETFLEIAAEVTDPVEWAALMLTKAPRPGMTVGEAMDAVKFIVREAIEKSNKKGK
jgi:hypothetical protein